MAVRMSCVEPGVFKGLVSVAATIPFRLSIGKVDVLSSKGCRSLTQVIAYRVNDGGHAWPGRDHPQNRTRGHVNRDIDASRIVSDWIMRLQDS